MLLTDSQHGFVLYHLYHVVPILMPLYTITILKIQDAIQLIHCAALLCDSAEKKTSSGGKITVLCFNIFTLILFIYSPPTPLSE